MKLPALIFLVLPMSVSAATGAELSGKWIHIKYPSWRVEISDNGSSFVVNELTEDNAKKYVAKLVDGILVINVGACGINADMEKKSGNLLFGGKEYRRLKSGESFDHVKKGAARF
jgi:hypothetical protein